MFQGCDVVHHAKRSRAAEWEQPSASIRSAAATALILPRFKRGTKADRETAPNREFLQLALNLLETGELSDADKGKPVELVHLAMSRWVDRMTKDFEVFFEFEANVFTADAYELEQQENEETSPVLFGLTPIYGTYTLQENLEALEKAFPGLGETSLALMQRAGYATLDLFTPARARDQSTMLYWNGADNDKDWLEEWEAQDMSPEEIEDAISPSWFDKHFPEWVIRPKQSLPVEVLSEIAASAKDNLAREVAALLIETEALLQMGAGFENTWVDERECVHFSAALRWNEDDPLLRVLDDHYEWANNSPDYFMEECCIHPIPLEPEKFLAWKKGVERAFMLMEKLDRLIVKMAKQL